MRSLFYAILLSTIYIIIVICDVVERSNETIANVNNINTSLENTNENNKQGPHIDSFIKTSNKPTNKTLIDDSQVAHDNSSISNPVMPIMSDNSSVAHSNESEIPVTTEDKSSHINDTLASEVIDTNAKEDVPATGTDDIPTFVEYQQMIEKETKQKREKSDSVPNSPTIILKDNHPIKGATDSAASHTAGEHSDTPLQSPSKTQETKVDTDVTHNSRKIDESKVEITTSTLSKSLMKNNVAAKECGAKILEISGQITNAAFVLNSNKDEYLNVPCSIPDKWFIVETCEPVQIRSIQIANFEMFSSRPKTFKVTTADRYPVKHWYNLGVFRALDEKGIQTFEVSDTRMVKYLKFDMVDHYGSEHYCPLTFVRVMGNVVIDDMDEESEEDQPAIGETHEVPKEAPSAIKSDGILTKAKDMIVKIVNGIGGSKKEEEQQTNQTDLQIEEDNSTANDHLFTSESPCYIFEFASKNCRNYLHDIWHHFHRLVALQKHLPSTDNRSLELTIRQQPFPLQIRAEYFALLEWINKSDYSFWRLYLSFANVSSQIPNCCLPYDQLQNLSGTFKCHIRHYSPSLEHYPHLPQLPNITTHVSDLDQISLNSTPSVATPNATIKTPTNGNDHNITSLPGQYEPALSGLDNVTSTANPPTTSSDSNIEDTQSTTTRNKTDESPSNLSQDNKTKETKPESGDNEMQKPSGVKYKSDEVFDNKLFASPGSNAWNYAFMRIKNIAKELEVNVSISMKYLEELSQNYKQQTDKLKKAQIVMAANVTRLENMIQRHRQDTKLFIKELKVQLQMILIRMKIAHAPDMSSSSGGSSKRTTGSMNLSSMDKREHDSDGECLDLLEDGLTLPAPSWLDSSSFLIVLNVFLSLLCNSVLLAIFYNKMKSNILNDVTRILSPTTVSTPASLPSSLSSSSNNNARNAISELIIEDIPNVEDRRRSLIEGSVSGVTFPVVLPPRGVHLSSFPDSDYLSDNDNVPRTHRGMGPLFYPVQPNVNFVTPSKDRKKKRRK